MTDMPNYSDANPWHDRVVYVSLETAAEIIASDVWLGKTADKPAEYWIEEWHRYGDKLDAYILPSTTGGLSLGIRYGREGPEYLSFTLHDSDAAQSVLENTRDTQILPGC